MAASEHRKPNQGRDLLEAALRIVEQSDQFKLPAMGVVKNQLIALLASARDEAVKNHHALMAIANVLGREHLRDAEGALMVARYALGATNDPSAESWKHARGPWKAYYDGDGAFTVEFASPEGNVEYATANADVIQSNLNELEAAKAGLLAASKSLLAFAESVRPSGAVLMTDPDFEAARAAIARAEGGGQ